MLAVIFRANNAAEYTTLKNDIYIGVNHIHIPFLNYINLTGIASEILVMQFQLAKSKLE